MMTSTFGLIFFVAFGLVFLTVIYVGISAKRQFGATPDGERLARIEKSPQYNKAKQIFENEIHRDFRKGIPFFGILRKLLLGPEVRTPTEPLPVVQPDLVSFLKSATSDRLARAI